MTSPLMSVACADALRRLGFGVESCTAKRVVLVRDGRRVFVPRHSLLTPAHVRAILRLARVEEADFVQALPSGASGTYSRTLVDQTPPVTRGRKNR